MYLYLIYSFIVNLCVTMIQVLGIYYYQYYFTNKKIIRLCFCI